MRYRVTVPYVTRVAAEDDIIPLANPVVGRDGKLIHEIFVPRGTPVDGGLVSSIQVHHNTLVGTSILLAMRLPAAQPSRQRAGRQEGTLPGGQHVLFAPMNSL